MTNHAAAPTTTGEPERTRWAPVVALGLGMLGVTSETTVVAVTLPGIGADLGVGPAATAWILLGYALPLGSLTGVAVVGVVAPAVPVRARARLSPAAPYPAHVCGRSTGADARRAGRGGRLHSPAWQAGSATVTSRRSATGRASTR